MKTVLQAKLIKKTALYWYEKSAKYGYPEAIRRYANYLSSFYFRDYGFEKDDEKARNLYIISALYSEPTAYLDLGNMFKYGWGGLEKNHAAAVKYYKKVLSYEGKYMPFGNSSYELYAKVGDLYLEGEHGLDSDKEQAIKWIKKGMEAGDPYAFSLMGYIYSNGLGVKKDYNKAIENYKKAAEPKIFKGYAVKEGNSHAFVNVGLMYERKKGTYNGLSHFGEACRWYQMALAKHPEHPKANYMVGSCWDRGHFNHKTGGKYNRDRGKALPYYQKAARLGYDQAFFEMSVIFADGYDGHPSDYKEMYYIYQMLKKYGDAEMKRSINQSEEFLTKRGKFSHITDAEKAAMQKAVKEQGRLVYPYIRYEKFL